MYILGITIGHNGSITLMEDTQIIFHIEEERISRLKRDSEPLVALDAIKRYTNVIDLLVISGTSEALKTNYTSKPFQEAYLNKHGIDVLHTIDEGGFHHRLHAYNAFLNSGFDTSLVLTIDGAGSAPDEDLFEAETISYMDRDAEGEDVYEVLFANLITTREDIDITKDTYRISTRPTIVKMFEGVTERIGYDVAEAGKTMGLSAYGKPDDSFEPLVDGDRGNKYFKPFYPAKTTLDAEQYGEFNDEVGEYEMNLSYAVQTASEELCRKLVQKAIDMKPDEKNICISGGYGLNVVNNFKLVEAFPDKNFWFEPTCNDGGNSIGAARMHSFLKFREAPKMESYNLGHSYEITPESVNSPFNISSASPQDIAELLVDGEIVAIYQGRSEAGPRALGNRSFMMDPRIKDGKDKMNVVKRREWFRPFAASVLEEHASKYFHTKGIKESRYMMIAFPTKKTKAKEIPAVVHEDGTTRIQTVPSGTGAYREIIEKFYELTGVPMVLNTSFNLAGEPLVETPQDAVRTLANAEFDYIYFADVGILMTKRKSSE